MKPFGRDGMPLRCCQESGGLGNSDKARLTLFSKTKEAIGRKKTKEWFNVVKVGSEVPLWVSVPPVNVPVFIGTRSEDPYGHAFYQYWVGTRIDKLTPIAVTDVDAIELAHRTAERLLPFVHPNSLFPFVQTAKLKVLQFGIARREHIVLLADDADYRWWLYTPIAEVSKLAINGQSCEYELRDGLIYIDGHAIVTLDGRGRAVFNISANTIEVAYAVGNSSLVVDEALPYFVAAAYMKAASDEQSGILESVRVGAVSFSFRSVKELKDKAAQLEKLGHQLLRVGGRM